MKDIRALILDMDGVLWEDSKPIGDLPATFEAIKKKGLKVAFATNNSTRTAQQYVEKLAGFGVEAEARQIFTSAKATAAYLREQHPEGGRVYVIGEAGLKEALAEAGFEEAEENVLAVVAGLDTRVDYEKLTKATLLIRDNAAFIGTNPDRTLPTPQGLVPGAGALLAALEAASGQKPTIIGKPHPTMFRQALKELTLEPHEALVVGDRLETDIAGGQAAKCPTALVLSGVTSVEMARNWKPAPDIIAADLAELIHNL